MAKSENKTQLVLVNVGFNKGYNFAVWANVFSPSTLLTPSIWHQRVEQVAKELPSHSNSSLEESCGACNDCHVTFPRFGPDNNSSRRLVMFGVDMNMANLELVRRIMNSFRAESNNTSLPQATTQPNIEGLSLELRHAAGSDHDGSMAVERCNPGKEMCAIPSHEHWNLTLDALKATRKTNKDGFTHVRLLTVDALTKEVFAKIHSQQSPSRVHEIDVLMIDTEGNDPLVLKGGALTLSRQLVRCLIFEYHLYGQWEFHTLEAIISQLDGYGYDCFFMGQARLWPLSHGCWHAKYEFRRWSNVMCLRRGDVWLQALQSLVVKPPSE